jgi:hypothetical protein
MLSLFGFGKKRRSTSKKSVKNVKPPSKLLKMCKKLKVKVSLKRGSKRVYKKAKVLAKQCKRKLRLIAKGISRFGSRSRFSFGTGRCGASKMVNNSMMMFGPGGCEASKMVDNSMMMFGANKARRSRFGSSNMAGYHMMPDGKMMADRDMMFGANKLRFAGRVAGVVPSMEFGKKRRVSPKVSKAAAMKAFKQFFRRHCSSTMRMGRRSRFGNGGNPPLYQSMGYEFCDLGSGGVLGANSTGLFPSPCKAMDLKAARAEEGVRLGQRYSGGDEVGKTAAELKAMDKAAITKRSAFGKKRRVAPKSKVVKKPSAKVLKLAKKLKIKVTLKRGGKRVYKSTKALNKQIKKALKKSH